MGSRFEGWEASMLPNMRVVLLLVLLMQCAVGVAQEMRRPAGRNCNLAVPPSTSGEEMNHGITLRIYPRARDIGDRYTGCQLMWVPHQNKWHVMSVVEVKAGDPVRIWSPDTSDSVRFSCIYSKGKVVKGDANNCAAPESLIAKSLAPGCVEKISQAVARGGIEAQWPAACQYE